MSYDPKWYTPTVYTPHPLPTGYPAVQTVYTSPNGSHRSIDALYNPIGDPKCRHLKCSPMVYLYSVDTPLVHIMCHSNDFLHPYKTPHGVDTSMPIAVTLGMPHIYMTECRHSNHTQFI